ncbi:MAG: A/G-specific adenine glycosylase [Candidatus Acidiferrales bacterium]
MRIHSFRRRLLEWYGVHKRSMPWRGTRDPYRVWVSEVMLQQTRVAAVVGYYQRFLRRFPTVRSLARGRETEVLKHWAGLGYYSRARNLHRAAREIVAKHGGRFPREFDAALALPGVGRYTAAAVLSIAYDAPHAALDGNVARVLARLFALRGDLRSPRRWRELQLLADALLPPVNGSHGVRRLAAVLPGEARFAGSLQRKAMAPEQKGGQARVPVLPGEWNQAMMELGAAVCTPRAPRCGACPVARWCRAHQLGIADEIPAARRKPITVSVKLAAAVLLDRRGRTLLLPPNGGAHDGLFSRLWQFPFVIATTRARALLRQRLNELSNGQGKALTQGTQSAAGHTETPADFIALQPAKHTVTFREVTLHPFLVRVAQLPQIAGARTPRLDQFEALAVSSATRKMARRALEFLAAQT